MKTMRDFDKQFNDFADMVSKYVNVGVQKVKDVADFQTRKMKLQSEIGQNQRDITKAYTKLGQAYYEAKENNAQMSDVEDVMELIRSKKKLVDMLQEKLDAMKDSEEE